jgi:hypothetical protein
LIHKEQDSDASWCEYFSKQKSSFALHPDSKLDTRFHYNLALLTRKCLTEEEIPRELLRGGLDCPIRRRSGRREEEGTYLDSRGRLDPYEGAARSDGVDERRRTPPRACAVLPRNANEERNGNGGAGEAHHHSLPPFLSLLFLPSIFPLWKIPARVGARFGKK